MGVGGGVDGGRWIVWFYMATCTIGFGQMSPKQLLLNSQSLVNYLLSRDKDSRLEWLQVSSDDWI